MRCRLAVALGVLVTLAGACTPAPDAPAAAPTTTAPPPLPVDASGLPVTQLAAALGREMAMLAALDLEAPNATRAYGDQAIADLVDPPATAEWAVPGVAVTVRRGDRAACLLVGTAVGDPGRVVAGAC